jgi:PleD family two-component response regulator
VQASSRVVSINKKLSGGYPVKGGAESGFVTVTASIGLTSWNPGDTMGALLERADDAMYEQKRDARRNAASGPAK